MNYQHLYDRFIEDRRAKEPLLSGYSERHHILPRSMGGDDSPTNLIRLTPEDHYFAHLVLAKIHGGRRWAPVVLWCGGDRGNWRAGKTRRNYGWAMRASSRHLGGEMAWQYDPRLRALEHKDGRRIEATQMALHTLIGGSKSGINMLLKGRIRSYLGWYLEGHRPSQFNRGNSGLHHHMADQRVHHWVHLSGAAFRGTRFDFCLKHGVSKKSACMIVNGQQVISKGWTLYGATIPTRGGAAHKSQKAA